MNLFQILNYILKAFLFSGRIFRDNVSFPYLFAPHDVSPF